MANEAFVHLSPRDLLPEAGGLPAEQIGVGLGKGLAFPQLQTSSALFAARVPEAVALATGLSFSLLLADDPVNADPGKVAVFGVTVGPITSGTSTFDENASTGPFAGCTEVTANVTTSSTVGVLSVLSVAVPVGDMNGLAAGGWAMIRVRRLGLNASDTHRRRVVLLGLDGRNT